ncbi:MAG: hypothetical protein NT075_24720, partial [Chloroflexi bacterium]|nr:hypothetical protein [Chloroflexota bacterium]
MNPQLLSQRALSTLIKSLLIPLFVCSMLWCAGSQTTVLAQTEPTVPLMQNMTKLWHWGGVISTMTPVSDTLYVGMGQDLVIFDIADPTSPKLLGQLSLDAWVYDLEIVGTHALIAAGSKGLLIVDVSDKQAPRLVAERHDPYTINSIAVAAPYAYMAYQGSTDTAIVNSIEILDVTDPETPIVVNPQITGLDFDPADLQIAANHLFVAGGKLEVGRYTYRTWGVFQAFDLADPTAPTPLPAYLTEPSTESEKRFNNLRLQGDYAYAVRSDSILRFTISTPAAITLNSQLNLATLNSSTLNVVSDQLYVTKQISTGGDNGGLYILDTSSPSTITVSDFLTQPVDALAVQGNYAFVGRNDDGLHVWDVTNPLAPREIGNYRILSAFDGDLVAHAPFLYVTGGIWGTPLLSTIDLHKPTEPTLTAVITGSDYEAFYPFIDDNWLLLSAKRPASYNFDNFQLFDITNPGVPQRIARHETTPFTSAAYADHQLYLETLNHSPPLAQISIFDLVTSTTPVITEIIQTAPQLPLMNFNDLSV